MKCPTSPHGIILAIFRLKLCIITIISNKYVIISYKLSLQTILSNCPYAYRRMLAPSCLTSLDRRKTNTKHTVESRRNLKTSFALAILLYQGEHSLTLDMCKDHCTVVGLWYATLPGLRFLSLLLQSFLFTTSVVWAIETGIFRIKGFFILCVERVSNSSLYI